MNEHQLLSIGVKLIGLLTFTNGLVSLIGVLATLSSNSSTSSGILSSSIIQMILGYFFVFRTENIIEIMNKKK